MWTTWSFEQQLKRLIEADVATLARTGDSDNLKLMSEMLREAPDHALGQTTNDLEQAGLIFNDAVRLSNGGLWSQPADDHGELNYASMGQCDRMAAVGGH
jgi:hypothetical protein